MTRKITKAEKTNWIVLRSQQSVLVFPNLSSGLGRPHSTGWICEEAAPEAATEEGHAILCDACFAAHEAGAEVVEGVEGEGQIPTAFLSRGSQQLFCSERSVAAR